MTVEQTEQKIQNPFVEATEEDSRLKILVFGGSGIGKTRFALRFPKPVIIDLDGGSRRYGKEFNFSRLPHIETVKDVENAVNFLRKEKHEYKTLIIDPITKFWEMLQEEWEQKFLTRNKSGKGFKFEYYDFQPNDWRHIKADLKTFIRWINQIDMNVVAIARAKKEYKDGQFMVPTGEEVPDAERNAIFEFDTVLQVFFNAKKEPTALCWKDRDHHLPSLPTEFSFTYEAIEKMVGKGTLNRAIKFVKRISNEDIDRVTKLMEQLEISEERMVKQLKEKDIADSIDMIPEKEVSRIIKGLEKMLKEKGRDDR